MGAATMAAGGIPVFGVGVAVIAFAVGGVAVMRLARGVDAHAAVIGEPADGHGIAGVAVHGGGGAGIFPALFTQFGVNVRFAAGLIAEVSRAEYDIRQVGATADGADFIHRHAVNFGGLVAVGLPAERQRIGVVVADDVVFIGDGDAAVAVCEAGHRPFGGTRVINHLLRLPAAIAVGVAAVGQVVLYLVHQLLLLELLLLVGGSSALLHQLLRGLRAGGATEQGEKEAGISRHGGTPQGCGTL